MKSKGRCCKLLSLTLGVVLVLPVLAQEVLPFPPRPSGSIAGRTMQESTYIPLPAVSHLTKDAPNILIVLIDDVGPAQSDTFGGAIHTRGDDYISVENQLKKAQTMRRIPEGSIGTAPNCNSGHDDGQ